jgi:hypothetical protein
MPTAKIYRAKAAELIAQAREERISSLRTEMEAVALSYLRLAEQAEINSKTDIVYETPPSPSSDQSQVQQQQQPQLKKQDD